MVLSACKPEKGEFRRDSVADKAQLMLISSPILLWALWRLARIDLAERRLPNRLTLPLVAAGLLLAALREAAVPWDEIAAAALGYALLALLGEAYWRMRQIEGLGLGDAKLFAAAGAWLGLAALPWVLLIASLGALIGVAAGLTRTEGGIAFGPWLAGAFAALHLARLVGYGP